MNKVISILVFLLFVLNAYSIDYAFKADYGVTATWNTNDAVGIFAKSDYETRFTIQSIDATNKHIAKVYGNGVSLLGNNSYYGFCPYSDYYYLHASVSNSLPISYTKLTQTQNNSMSHIAPQDFMIANVTTTTSDQATFAFEHLGCILRLSVKVPDTSIFNAVTLETSKGTFLQNGTLNIETQKITTKTSSRTVELALNNISVSKSGQLTVFFMLPASDLTGGTMTATFCTTSGKTYTCSFGAQNYIAGKLYNVERTLQNSNQVKTLNLQPSVDDAVSARAKVRRAASKITYPTCVVKDFLLAQSDIKYAPIYIMGDANGDGKVTILDLVLAIKHVNNKNPLPFNKDAVDFDNDAAVTMKDISKLYNMILSK